MRAFSMAPLAPQRSSAADASTAATIILPKGTSGFFVTVETTNARLTFDGSDPAAASAPSTVFPKDQPPVWVPANTDTVVKWVSTSGVASVVQVAPWA